MPYRALSPPPKKNDRGWAHFFRICVYCNQIFFPKENVEFVGNIRTRTPKNDVFCHSHSNAISTKLTLFDIN